MVFYSTILKLSTLRLDKVHNVYLSLSTLNKGNNMICKVQYPITDNYEYFFEIEADCLIDDSDGYQSTVVDFVSVKLNGEMALRINEIPPHIKEQLEQKVKDSWNPTQKSFHRSAAHLPPLLYVVV